MGTYIIKRLLTMIPLWLLLSLITFFLVELPPGDVVTNQVMALRAQNLEVDAAAVARMRAQWGLDDPFLVRYVQWLENILLHGELGKTVDGRENLDVLMETIPYTVVIAVAAFIIALGIAIPLGIYSATHQYSVLDYVITFLAFTGLGAPGWLLAIIIAWASLYFFDFVPLGINSLEYLGAPWSWGKFLDTAKHLWLPIILTAIPALGVSSRIIRNNLLDQLEQQYVVTARAKGIQEGKLVRKYPRQDCAQPSHQQPRAPGVRHRCAAGPDWHRSRVTHPRPLASQLVARPRHDPGGHDSANLRDAHLGNDPRFRRATRLVRPTDSF